MRGFEDSFFELFSPTDIRNSNEEQAFWHDLNLKKESPSL
jgi:hypothetical protein